MRYIVYLVAIMTYATYALADERVETITVHTNDVVEAEVQSNEYTAPDPCTLDVVNCEGDNMDRDAIERLIRATFPEDPATAVSIAHCESRLDPTRIGDTHTEYYSYGVFQIRLLPGRIKYAGLTREKLLDARQNIAYARKIYDRFGWRPWTCAKIIKK